LVRPLKSRQVAFVPGVTFFKPSGVSMRELEEVRLTVEEVEAIRLKDLEMLEQEESAVRMNISRPTFQRVLASARQKIADALLNGKAIRIEGGNYQVVPVVLHCAANHQWEVPFQVAAQRNPQFCPVCNGPALESLPPGRSGLHGLRRGWRRRGSAGRNTRDK